MNLAGVFGLSFYFIERKMGEKSSFENLFVIVVGTYGDSFINYLTSFLRRLGIEFCLCKNIYTAMVKLTQKGDKGLVVFGRIELLDNDKGRFFSKAKENGVFCCCFTEGTSWRRQNRVIRAKDAGAFVMTVFEQIEEFFEKMPSISFRELPDTKRFVKNHSFMKKTYQTTQEELDALLGT